MTDPSRQTSADAPEPASPPQPGDRRLVRPPSDRYEAAESAPPIVDPGASTARGLAYAVVAALVGAIGLTVLGGILALSAGLLVAAAVTGWAIAAGLRIGAGPRLGASSRVRVALVMVTLAIAAGQVGLWLYARSEGGVLGPLDYLGETFGILVPFEFLTAWVVAWASAR